MNLEREEKEESLVERSEAIFAISATKAEDCGCQS